MPESGSEQKDLQEQEKAKLSQVIAGIVASVAGARSIADAESLRIARYYRTHELLKGMPVPRLRFRRVSVSLPVVLKEFIPEVLAKNADPAEIARKVWEALIKEFEATSKLLGQLEQNEEPTEEEHRQTGFYKRLIESARKRYEERPQDLRERLQADIEYAFLDLDAAEGGGPSDSAIRDTAAATAEEWFRGIMKELLFVYVKNRVGEERSNNPNLDEFQPNRARQLFNGVMNSEIIQGVITVLRHEAENTSVTRATTPPDFYVEVDTDIIKNTGGGPDTVTRVNMVMLEEGLEWLTETREGVEHTKLALE